MNKAYCFQSSLILYFFNAAGKTFQQGSSSVTRKLLAARLADSFALEEVVDLSSATLEAAVFDSGTVPDPVADVEDVEWS